MTNAKTKGTDLSSIDPVAACAAGTDLELLHPATGDPLGVFMRILGQESDELRAFAKGKAKEGAKKAAANRHTRRDVAKIAEETVDGIFDRKASVDLAVAATVGWWRFENEDDRKGRVENVVFEGSEVAFSKEAARRLFEARPWMALQVDAGTQDIASFFPT